MKGQNGNVVNFNLGSVETMTARTEELARQFEDSSDTFVNAVESVDEQDWNNLCPAENWTVGLTAHHVAYSYPILVDVMRDLAAGIPRPLTYEYINEVNEEHAREFADCGKTETVAKLRQGASETAAALRELDDSALDVRHDLPFLGAEPVTLERFISSVVIAHNRSHLESIRSAARL
jgi:hypothetical protein